MVQERLTSVSQLTRSANQGMSALDDDSYTNTAPLNLVVSHQNICAGCNQFITDKYLLKAVDQVWHEDCLKCSCCDCRLGEVGSSLFIKSNLLLCKTDYLRLFGVPGQCSACLQPIPAFEMVMRAREHVYHLDCFACQYCRLRFCVGDRFYLSGNHIYCENHFNESMTESNNISTDDLIQSFDYDGSKDIKPTSDINNFVDQTLHDADIAN